MMHIPQGLLLKNSRATLTCLVCNKNSTKSVMSNFKEGSYFSKMIVVLQMTRIEPDGLD